MRMQFRSVTYTFGGASSSLARHYRELRDELLRQGHHFGIVEPTGQWRPPADIHETPDAILVKMELAGMREDNIEITLYENALVVAGLREDDSDHDESICYHEAQVRYGPFRADILLPAAVRAEAVEATYQNGFLRVKLLKAAPSEPGLGSRGTSGEEGAATSGVHQLNAAPPALTPSQTGNALATAIRRVV